jgi:hypothetical protein
MISRYPDVVGPAGKDAVSDIQLREFLVEKEAQGKFSSQNILRNASVENDNYIFLRKRCRICK